MNNCLLHADKLIPVDVSKLLKCFLVKMFRHFLMFFEGYWRNCWCMDGIENKVAANFEYLRAVVTLLGTPRRPD